MEATTMYMVQLLGPIFIVSGLALIFRGDLYEQMMKDFKANLGLSYTYGVLAMVAGIAILLSHNIWNTTIAAIVSAMAIGMTIKGILLMTYPEQLMNLAVKSKTGLIIAGLIAIAVGIWFSYVGYLG